MMDLEERIFRDASAAAAEITPADIPQLQLQLGGRAPRASARRILTPVAAAASVVALIAIVVVVGQGSSGPAHPRSSPRSSPAAGPYASPASMQLATEALDWYFPASGATYTEGLAFAWTQDKIKAKDIDPCLAAGGFPQPAFRGSMQLYQLSFRSSQFPDLAQLVRHPGQYYFTSQYLVARDPTSSRLNAMGRLQASCTARYAGAVTRVDRAASSLAAAWMNIVSAIQSSHRISATQPAFARCLEAHGVPASDATQTLHAANPLFAGYFAWADTLNQSATSSAGLKADQVHENRVFATCARPVVAVLEPIQLAHRAQFFRAHAAQIAHIAKLAREMAS